MNNNIIDIDRLNFEMLQGNVATLVISRNLALVIQMGKVDYGGG